MLEKLSEKHLATLVRVAKTRSGLRPFFGSPKGMIKLRDEAYARGIYLTHGDKMEADRKVQRVCSKMED